MVQAGRQYNKKSSSGLIDIMGALQRGLLFFHNGYLLPSFCQCVERPQRSNWAVCIHNTVIVALSPPERVTFSRKYFFDIISLFFFFSLSLSLSLSLSFYFILFYFCSICLLLHLGKWEISYVRFQHEWFWISGSVSGDAQSNFAIGFNKFDPSLFW